MSNKPLFRRYVKGSYKNILSVKTSRFPPLTRHKSNGAIRFDELEKVLTQKIKLPSESALITVIPIMNL